MSLVNYSAVFIRYSPQYVISVRENLCVIKIRLLKLNRYSLNVPGSLDLSPS